MPGSSPERPEIPEKRRKKPVMVRRTLGTRKEKRIRGNSKEGNRRSKLEISVYIPYYYMKEN